MTVLDRQPPRHSFAGAAGAAVRPLVVAFNHASGASDKEEARRKLEGALKEAGRSFEFLIAARHEPVTALCDRAARQAAAIGGALVIAGGDGSVNAAAEAARKHGVPLGLVPQGTFNFFARSHGIPDEPEKAARVLLEGTVREVPAGEVNGRVILNNASFGLYTRMIEQREQANARFGRRRLIAALTAASALLAGQRAFSIRLVSDQAAERVRTSMVFVACNGLQLESLGLDAASCTRAGALGVLVLKRTRLSDRLRLLWRTALKDLDADHRLESFCATDFEVESRRPVINCVIDGEMVRLRTPLHFRALPAALQLIVPDPARPAAE